MQAEQKKFWEAVKKCNLKQQSEGAHFRNPERTEAKLCGQKTVTHLKTTKVSSSAWISSPTNFLYALGISDREVRKDKESFFIRKFLAHQETATQYYMVGILMWNLNRLVSEQVKNWNFFVLRQTAERSKLEDFHQFWFSEYCAQVIWTVTTWELPEAAKNTVLLGWEQLFSGRAVWRTFF